MTRFKKGQSGNPNGRPPGSVNGQLQLCRTAADQILPALVEKALDGDLDAARMILDRAVPKAKPQTVAAPFAMPDQGLMEQVQAVLGLVAAGEMSPTTAGEVAGLVATAAKVEEIDQLRAEVAALKRTLEARPKP